MILLRSMLYFPANSARMAIKAATLPTDAVIFDLEDAVSLDDKETARILARDFVRLTKQHGTYTFVRVNSLSTGLTDEDVNCAVAKGLDGVMLAKTETRSDVVKLCQILDGFEKKTGIASQITIIPLIESARGVMNSFEIASASDRVAAVAFGAGDYYRDLGGDVSQVSREENELLYARSHIVNASRAAGVQAIDTPFLGSLTDKDAFLGEVKLAARLGFKGKQCVHPSQIELVNKTFSPSETDINRASRIVRAFEEATARGLGVMSFEGKMVDRMTYCQAKDMLTTAQMIQERTEIMSGRTTYVSLDEVFSKRQ